jgi:hypothetical protein
VRLYTDKLPPGVEQVPDPPGSVRLRNEEFKNYALPFYVIVKPKGETLQTLAKYEKGLIPDVEDFAAFLKEGLEAARR